MGLPYEINPNSRDVALGVRIISESKQQARLSDTRVTDEEELEEVIVSVQIPILATNTASSRQSIYIALLFFYSCRA